MQALPKISVYAGEPLNLELQLTGVNGVAESLQGRTFTCIVSKSDQEVASSAQIIGHDDSGDYAGFSFDGTVTFAVQAQLDITFAFVEYLGNGWLTIGQGYLAIALAPAGEIGGLPGGQTQRLRVGTGPACSRVVIEQRGRAGFTPEERLAFTLNPETGQPYIAEPTVAAMDARYAAPALEAAATGTAQIGAALAAVDDHLEEKDAEIAASVAAADAARDQAAAQGALAADKAALADTNAAYAKTQGDGAKAVIDQQVGNLAQTAADRSTVEGLAAQVSSDKQLTTALHDTTAGFMAAAVTAGTSLSPAAGATTVANLATFWAIDPTNLIRLYQRRTDLSAGYADLGITLPNPVFSWQPLPRESGYLGAFMDINQRPGWAVTTDGHLEAKFVPGSIHGEALTAATLPLAALGSDVTTLLAQPMPRESGYLWGVLDLSSRGPLRIAIDGTVEADKFRSPSLPGNTIALQNANYVVAGYQDANLRWQIRTIRRSDGKVTNLALTSGSNVNPSLTEYDEIMFYSTGPVPGFFLFPLAGGLITPLEPTGVIDAQGDSLTLGYGAAPADSWPTVLAAMMGRTINNYGVYSQTSVEVVARQGGNPALVSVTGGQIPASGAVTMSAYSVDFLIAVPSAGLTGTLAGVAGTMRASGGSGARFSSTYTFTRTNAGDVVTVADNTPFLVDQGTSGRGNIQLLEMGRNNYAQPSQVLADYASAVAYLTPRYKRFLVATVPNDTSEIIGTAKYNQIMALNAAIQAAYPNNYIDIHSPPTTSELQTLAPLGYVPTQQDLTDIANGTIPTGMRANPPADVLHFNKYGNLLQAIRRYAAITSRGW